MEVYLLLKVHQEGRGGWSLTLMDLMRNQKWAWVCPKAAPRIWRWAGGGQCIGRGGVNRVKTLKFEIRHTQVAPPLGVTVWSEGRRVFHINGFNVEPEVRVGATVCRCDQKGRGVIFHINEFNVEAVVVEWRGWGLRAEERTISLINLAPTRIDSSHHSFIVVCVCFARMTVHSTTFSKNSSYTQCTKLTNPYSFNNPFPCYFCYKLLKHTYLLLALDSLEDQGKDVLWLPMWGGRDGGGSR